MSEPEEEYDRDILRPRSFYFDWPVSDRTFAHCCKYFRSALEFTCHVHASPFECGDNVFVYNEVYDEYGAIKRNPEFHYTLLAFCPFCGTRLPPSRDEDWNRELTAMGFDLFGDAMGEAHDRTGSYTQAWREIGVPERYLSAAWRLPTGA